MHESAISFQEKEAFYALFASFFLSPPNTEQMRIFSNSETMRIFAILFRGKQKIIALKELTSYLSTASIGNLKNEFDSLFVVPNKRNYVPPYESCFREKRGTEVGNFWGETTADVARFYREAGYEAKTLQGIFAPDHIGVELAFIAKLCADELQLIENNNDSEQIKKIEELRKSFLREHLSEWIEDFSKAVNASPSAFFYKNLSTLTAHMVHSDLKSS